MRDFSDYEKDIIKRIASECNKEGYSISMNIIVQEMEKVGIVAIEWDKTYTYTNFHGINDHKSYKRVFDIIFLLKYLEENRFIHIHSKDEKNYYSLFSIERYKKIDDFYWRIIDKNITGANKLAFSTMHTNIGREIQNTSKGIIYASYALEDLIQNKFESPEQKRFRKSHCATWIAIFIAILTGLSGIYLTLNSQNKPIKLDSIQLNQIKHAILKQKSSEFIDKKQIHRKNNQ